MNGRSERSPHGRQSIEVWIPAYSESARPLRDEERCRHRRGHGDAPTSGCESGSLPPWDVPGHAASRRAHRTRGAAYVGTLSAAEAGRRRGEASARPSVSRVLSRRLAPSRMAIHLGPPVARRLMRPTRGLGSAPLPRRVAPRLRPPIWPCSGWSLPRFTPPPARAGGGIVTVALVLVSRRTGVTRHPALRSSDFPHAVTGLPPTWRAAIRRPR